MKLTANIEKIINYSSVESITYKVRRGEIKEAIVNHLINRKIMKDNKGKITLDWGGYGELDELEIIINQKVETKEDVKK